MTLHLPQINQAVHNGRAALRQAIIRHIQQSTTANLGEYKSMRCCVPTCFYALAEAYGYIDSATGPTLYEFVDSLDWENDFDPSGGWIRPKLSEALREKYGIAIVSWTSARNDNPTEKDILNMRAAGYLSSDREEVFYREQIMNRSVKEIVASGLPVIAGVKAGFATAETTHAIIISHWENGQVQVLDPDERDPEEFFSEEHILKYLNPIGGCSVVLPKEE